MALAFPVPLDDFFRTALVRGGTFDLGEATEVLTLGGGEVLTSQAGTRLWHGTAEFTIMSHAEAEDTMARIRVLQRPGASFLVSCLHGERPGAATCLLNGVQSGREVRLSGLAAGTVVARGAFLSWTYGSSPTRYAFHQLAEALVANGSGVTGYGEVSPSIRPGYTIGATVQLSVPRLKAVLVPGSLKPARARRTVAEGLAFDWTQTLR